jgi:hypothetical protein
VICGVVFGVVDVLLMIPLTLPDKKTAMLGAFFDRFAIGLLTCVVAMPIPPWAVGLVTGTLISLPSAIVTRAYVPILVIGAAGGAIIGIVNGKLG